MQLFRAQRPAGGKVSLLAELSLLRQAVFYLPLLALLLLVVIGALAANQIPRTYQVNVGDPAQAAFVNNFHSSIGGGAARWSESYSYITLPGVGGGVPLNLDLDIASGENRPGAPAKLDVLVNGEMVAQGLAVPPARGVLSIPVDASHQTALAARDLFVELRSTTYTTTEPPTEERGVLVFGLKVSFQQGIIWPALRVWAYVVVAVLLVYLFFARLLADRRVVLGASALALLALLAGVALALPRLTPLLPKLVIALALAYPLLGVIIWAAPNLWPLLRREGRYLRKALSYLPLYALLIVFVAGLVAAYQVPHDYFIDLGTPGDDAYASNFHGTIDYEGAQARWTDNYAYLTFGGIGGGVPLHIQLRVAGGPRPADAVPQLMVIVNGVNEISEQRISNDLQTLDIKIDASNKQALDNRDLVVELRAPTFVATDVAGERRGVLVDWVRVEQGSGFIVPTQRVLIALTAALLFLFIWLVRAGFRRRIAFALTFISAALLVGLMAWLHLPLSSAAPHLFVTALSAYVLLVLADLLLRVTAQRPDQPHARYALYAAAIFAAGWALRYGAQGLPQANVIDLPYHMKWLRILLTGDWQSLYYPGQLSVVPPEWGLSVLIPKSPLFYFFAAPLGWLPFDLTAEVKWLITLLDACSILFAFILARKWFNSDKVGLWAAGLYAIFPLAFRSLVYGILPTVQAQWMTWLLFMLLLWQWPRLTRWQVMVPLVLLLTATLIAFPTIAVFNTLMLLGLAVWRRMTEGKSARNRSLALVGAAVAAIALSVLIYYGQYIEPVFGVTLPALINQFEGHGSKGVGAGTTRWPGGPLDMVGWTVDYEASFLPLVLGALGMALLWPILRVRGKVAAGTKRLAQMLALWLAIGVLFFCANYVVDMIGKHLYYTMLPLCITGGVTLFLLARRRGVAGIYASLALLAVAWAGINLWFGRIIP